MEVGRVSCDEDWRSACMGAAREHAGSCRGIEISISANSKP